MEGRRLGLGGPGRGGGWGELGSAWRSAGARCASRAGADSELGVGCLLGEEAVKSELGMHLIACISQALMEDETQADMHPPLPGPGPAKPAGQVFPGNRHWRVPEGPESCAPGDRV